MTEVWKTIPGYEGLYEIISMGKIKSLRTGLLRRDVNSGRGYRAIQLSDSNAKKHRLYVHRLVALAFLGPPPSEEYQVNHINLVKADNRVENLEWVTPDENMAHAYRNGKTDYRRSIRKDNKLGIKGVYPNEGGYEVRICGHYVGWYKRFEDAVIARKEAEENEQKKTSNRH